MPLQVHEQHILLNAKHALVLNKLITIYQFPLTVVINLYNCLLKTPEEKKK